VEVELLLAETKRPPASREGHNLHLQNTRVKRARRFDIADGKNEMVKALNLHGCFV
jgi:hypothetical protein